MSYLKLIRGHPFVGGHLFEHVTPDKLYKVIGRHNGTHEVRDDTGKSIWVSKTALKRYMKLCAEEIS